MVRVSVCFEAFRLDNGKFESARIVTVSLSPDHVFGITQVPRLNPFPCPTGSSSSN